MDISQLRNPYDFRNPVRDDAIFSGRKQETQAIRHEFSLASVGRPSVCVVLHGPRAAGKTSLLNAADRMARDRGFTTVRVDLIEGDGGPSIFYRKVYEELLIAVADALRALGRDIPFELAVVRRIMAGVVMAGPDDKLAFPEAMALAKKRGDDHVPEAALRADIGLFLELLGHPIALLVDEAQVMAADTRVLSILRFLTSRVDGLVVVLAGTSGLVEQIRSVHSQILRQFKEVEVKRFANHEDVWDCVLQPLNALGPHPIRVRRGVVQELMQLTDGNPYEIQLYCHAMFARMQLVGAELLELTPEVLEAIRSQLETGRDLMDRPLIRAVRAMSTTDLVAFAILTSALGRATADQAWFAHVIADDPQISREAYDNCHRSFVNQGLLAPDEIITFAVETELLDEIYVRVYTVSRVQRDPHGQFTGRGGTRSLFVNRVLGLLHRFERQGPLRIMPTCCYMMKLATVEKNFAALEILPEEGPDATPTIDLVHKAVLEAGEPAALDLTSVTCQLGELAVERWLFSSDVDDIDLASLPEFVQAADRIARYGGKLETDRVRIPLRTWPAEEWFGRATGRLRSDLAHNHRHAAFDAYEGGDRDRALRHFKAAYDLSPAWEYANSITHVCLASGAVDEGLKWSSIALELASIPANRALSAYNMAIAHLVSRTPAVARRSLDRAAEDLASLEVREYPTGYLMVPDVGDPTKIREELGVDLYAAVDRVRKSMGPEGTEEPTAADSSGQCAPVVLAVATEWASSHGGLSTLNREMCCALARAGAEVYCIVLSATPEELAFAAAAGVTLLPAPSVAGESDDMRLSGRPALLVDKTPDLIVGHSRITGFAARRLADAFYPQARRLHFVHMAPDEIEWHKPGRETDAGLRASERTEIERGLGKDAYRVVAIGPRLHDQFLTEFTSAPLAPLRMDPGFDVAVDCVGTRTPPAGQPLRVLLLGRTEDAELKGVQLAAAACGKVDKWQQQVGEHRVRLVVRGAQPGTGEKEREAISALSGNADLQVVVREYTSKEEAIEHDLDTASMVLMPSRSEGFGLVGLEAIVRGVPVLITSASGLGQLLRETSRQMANRFVVPVTGDVSRDTDTWARAIERILRDRESAFQHVADLRDLLAQKITWAAAADTVLSQAAFR
ncbi:glycosyltransferase [Streptomyces sp. OfavH-34-F]|uniref:glycosyltransferase n=1 Tax=Streptomyces sp. OfavH-34-F TaxID=2917760 RepID=UPI001EF1D759|nr:glycosyltransferase [Streptomyces sp. OfavH-34-F]MCG7523352.1 glycosyltransferase [Streptomyces sp. OfavH-34-F]